LALIESCFAFAVEESAAEAMLLYFMTCFRAPISSIVSRV